jgi:hypothetical protein
MITLGKRKADAVIAYLKERARKTKQDRALGSNLSEKEKEDTRMLKEFNQEKERIIKSRERRIKRANKAKSKREEAKELGRQAQEAGTGL